MGRKRSAKTRQREAERRKQLQQHGVKVLGMGMKKKSGANRKNKNARALLDEQVLAGHNPFATKRNSGKSIKLRQKTLLHDYKSRSKSTRFADRRLGENDSDLAVEDRALLRVAKERAKSFKGNSKYNIDLEGDEEGFEEREELLPSDDDEMFQEQEEALTTEQIADMARFGGMTRRRGAEDRVRMLEEEMAKKQHEMNDPLQELKDLDAEYGEMEQEVVRAANAAVKAGRVPEERQTSDFDQLVLQLQMEPRNEASNHIKTQEERDKEYQKKLERLEKERIRRMADDGTGADDDDAGILDVPAHHRKASKKAKTKGGDTKELKVLSPEAELADLPLPELLKKHLLAIPTGAGKTDTLTRRYNLLWTAIEKYVSATKASDLAPINRAIRTLFEMTQSIPRPAAHWCRAWCQSLHQQLAAKTNPNYPRLSHLIVLQLFPILFPSTDFRHPVMTPAFLIMSCLLTSCNVASLRNIAAGLHITTCYLEAIREAKRFVPEAVTFLTSTLLLTSSKYSRVECLPPFQKLSASKKAMLACKSPPTTDSTPKLSLRLLQVGAKEMEESEEEIKQQLIYTALRLLSTAFSIYSSYTAVFDGCKHVLPCLRDIASSNNHPRTTRNLSTRLADKIEQQTTDTRHHLQLQAHRPVPLPELVPEFNEVFIDRKGRKISGEERDIARLQHQYKKERKGAIKELRKDTKFLARVRLEEQKERDAERWAKVKEVEALMAESRHEEKMLKRPRRR